MNILNNLILTSLLLSFMKIHCMKKDNQPNTLSTQKIKQLTYFSIRPHFHKNFDPRLVALAKKEKNLKTIPSLSETSNDNVYTTN